jgi:hypothetical protein
MHGDGRGLFFINGLTSAVLTLFIHTGIFELVNYENVIMRTLRFILSYSMRSAKPILKRQKSVANQSRVGANCTRRFR